MEQLLILVGEPEGYQRQSDYTLVIPIGRSAISWQPHSILESKISKQGGTFVAFL